ncbi:protein-tyrosine phosphatase-like protein, partial [Pelagophyceae sp. CCMP2097]
RWVRAKLGGGVVFNCAQGKSRSATLATAFLMFQHDVSAVEALARIQRARPFLQPNAGFLSQLLDLEPMLR